MSLLWSWESNCLTRITTKQRATVQEERNQETENLFVRTLGEKESQAYLMGRDGTLYRDRLRTPEIFRWPSQEPRRSQWWLARRTSRRSSRICCNCCLADRQVWIPMIIQFSLDFKPGVSIIKYWVSDKGSQWSGKIEFNNGRFGDFEFFIKGSSKKKQKFYGLADCKGCPSPLWSAFCEFALVGAKKQVFFGVQKPF